MIFVITLNVKKAQVGVTKYDKDISILRSKTSKCTFIYVLYESSISYLIPYAQFKWSQAGLILFMCFYVCLLVRGKIYVICGKRAKNLHFSSFCEEAELPFVFENLFNTSKLSFVTFLVFSLFQQNLVLNLYSFWKSFVKQEQNWLSKNKILNQTLE